MCMYSLSLFYISLTSFLKLPQKCHIMYVCMCIHESPSFNFLCQQFFDHSSAKTPPAGEATTYPSTEKANLRHIVVNYTSSKSPIRRHL